MPSGGQRTRAVDFPATASDIQAAASPGQTTSTSYTATLTGGTACGVTFIAPTSGKVEIANNCQLVNSAAASTYCSFAVRTGSTIGSGTSVLSVSDDEAIINTGTSVMRMGTTRTLTGLTPGSTYNAQQNFKVASGTGTFARKQLSVKPLP